MKLYIQNRERNISVVVCFYKMDLKNLFEARLDCISNLNDFIVLYGRKEDISSNLLEIITETKQVKFLLASCVEYINKFQIENSEKCKILIRKLQVQQCLTLQIFEKVSERDLPKVNQQIENMILMPKDIENTPTPNKLLRKLGDQPIMTLADYVKSPYATKRMRPVALQFTDFERNISVEEFLQVPG